MELIVIILVCYGLWKLWQLGWLGVLICIGVLIVIGIIAAAIDDPAREKAYSKFKKKEKEREKGKPSKNIKDTLYLKQEGKCSGCDLVFPMRNLELDHIVPRSKDGSNTDDNLQLLCGYCNRKKGNRSQKYLKESLRKEGEN